MELKSAYHVSVRQILNSKFIIRDESMPDTLLLENGENVYRINLMGFLVDRDKNTLVVDDGTGTVPVRLFERPELAEGFQLGELLQVIGRVREFEADRYIFADIVSKVDTAWIKVRTLEIRSRKAEVSVEPVEKPDKHTVSAEDRICGIIKSMDNGDGVPAEWVTDRLPGARTEETIRKMLENGIIFMPRPGRLKLLKS